MVLNKRILFYLLGAIIIFMASLSMEKNQLNQLYYVPAHHWQTGSTIKYVDNWFHDGFIEDRGMMLDYPDSIEHPNLRSRGIYVSYLSGAVFEVALLKSILPNTSTLLLVTIVNLLNQLLISLALGFLFMSGLESNIGQKKHVLAFLIFASYVLLPASLHLHSVAFFADTCVLLPFVLILYAELLIRKAPDKKNLTTLFITQSILILWAFFCDWFAIPILIAILIYRIILPLPGHKNIYFQLIQLGLLPAFALFIFLLQLYHFDMLPNLLDRFILRSGQVDDYDWLFVRFIKNFFIWGLGFYNIILLLFSYLFIFFQLHFKKSKINCPLYTICAIGILACLMHAFLLTNHSVIHSAMAIVKFDIIYILIIVGIIPALMLHYCQSRSTSSLKLSFFCSLLFILTVLVSLLATPKVFRELIDRQVDLPGLKIALWLRNNAHYEDVYLSNRVNFGAFPPQVLAISRKEVHAFYSQSELSTFFAKLPANTNYFGVLTSHEFEKCKTPDNKMIAQIDSDNLKWIVFNMKPGTQMDGCLIAHFHPTKPPYA